MNARDRKIPEYILKRIAQAEGRMTDARKAVILYFLKSKKPKSIQEIVPSVHVDEVSVYRIIAFFQSIEILEEIFFPGGVKRYALAEGHHHHVICTSCGFVEHILCSENKTPQMAKMPESFKSIRDHSVTYYGLCTKCGT